MVLSFFNELRGKKASTKGKSNRQPRPQSKSLGATFSEEELSNSKRKRRISGNDQGTSKKKRGPRKKRSVTDKDSNEEGICNLNKGDSLEKRSVSSCGEEKGKKQRPEKKKKRDPPSQDALQLSERLKELSQQKNLKGALEIYWDKSNDGIRDEHHACILVDCCSRCGDIEEAENILEGMKASGMYVNVETKTALLKGYSHSGMIRKADTLFDSLCTGHGKRNRPNVRSLNTLLRACLWTAASVDDADTDKAVGGIVTAEKAWENYRRIHDEGSSKEKLQNNSLDASSYEYMISLLCQTLRAKQAEDRINDFMLTYDISRSFEDYRDQDTAESLAVSFLGLSRAYTLLGNRDGALSSCQRALDAVKASTALLNSSSSGHTTLDSKRGDFGGKRARKHRKDGENNIESRRVESNILFRTHRLSGVESDINAILRLLGNKSVSFLSPRNLSRRLLSRLLVFSGGGTTDLAAVQGKLHQHSNQQKCHDDEKKGTSTDTTNQGKLIQYQLVNTAFLSFGLAEALAPLEISMPNNSTSRLKRRDCNRILGAIGLQGGVIDKDGTINFSKIFSSGVSDAEESTSSAVGGSKKKKRKKKNKNKKLDIELGAGFGEWIVNQAVQKPSRNFVAVELRADRVGQIFTRASLCPPGTKQSLDNICVVGSESGNFLRNRVKNNSVSTIFVNHPEPPTQTFGRESDDIASILSGEGVEPAHMLNSNMLIAAAKCLMPSSASPGRLVIVTDNRWYGRLLCATLVNVIRNKEGLYRPVNLIEEATSNGQFEIIESFPLMTIKDTPRSDFKTEERICLFKGQPCEAIGHATSSSSPDEHQTAGISYFDRLWRSGAGGNHAERTNRYIIVMARESSTTRK